MKKKYIIPAMLVPMAFMVGCSNIQDNKTESQQEIIAEQEITEEELEQIGSNALTGEEVESVFSGVWVHYSEELKANIYLKMTEEKYEYQTSKECYLNYEAVKDIQVDADERKIVLSLSSHDEQDMKAYIEVLDTETIIVRGNENDEGQKYVKLTTKEDKEVARKDLESIWQEYFGMYDTDEYPLEDFLEIEK